MPPSSSVPRVLRVIPSIDPEVGGPSYHLVNAALAEARAGTAHAVVACTRRPGQPDPESVAGLRAEGIGYVAFDRPRIASGIALRWGISPRLAVWMLWNARRFDVIHVDFVWTFGGIVAAVAGRLWGRPVIMTPHESLTRFEIAQSRSPRRAQQKLAMRRLLLRGVDEIVVSSRLEAEHSDLDDHVSHVVSHPIDAGGPPHDRRRPTPAAGELTVGFLGRLHPKKRLEMLIDAVGRTGTGVRLDVGGDQPPERFRTLGEEVAASPDAGRIALHGFVPGSGRDAFFDGIDVLAMPSDFECFGMSAAEAMVAGVPVVVSDHVGVADVVTEYGAGVVVPRDDPAALARALDDLAAHPERLGPMGDAARRGARERFSYAAYGAEIGVVYDEVSARRRPTLRGMASMALQRRWRQAIKLTRLVRVPEYRRALRFGVAATVEHDRAPLPDDLATVVDVGANRGQFAVMASHRWPDAQLVCFEPLPEPRGLLQQALGGHARLRVVDAAVSDEEGTAEFHISRSDDCSSLLPVTDTHIETFPDSVAVESVPVRIVRIDAVLDAPIARPALLKIDVQGAELGALRGAVGVLDQFDAILVEVSFAELYGGQALASDIIRFLDDHGFVLTSMGAPSNDAEGRTLQTDLVFGPRTTARPEELAA
ncbi:FkbM family methyltransferase [Patulibacter minatonensis]|uniref:FkbM family methyltransferase n=1 Tax=Patulibacter minatonensis TaxID=298163 RepID=UPI00068467D0|nr:FkbM family methyltransferase [Patulibacter minatonensis]